MEAWTRPDAEQREQGLCGLCSLGTPSTGEKELLSRKMPLRHVDYKLHRACQKEEEVLPLVLFAFIKFVSVCMCNTVCAVYWDVCVQIHASMHAEARESVLPYYFTRPYSLESGSLGEPGRLLAPEILLSLPHLQALLLQTMPGFFVVWF